MNPYNQYNQVPMNNQMMNQPMMNQMGMNQMPMMNMNAQPSAPTMVSTTTIISQQPVYSPFMNGQMIHLQSLASKLNLRVLQNGFTIEGKGGKGGFATWKVHVVGPNSIKLQSAKFPSKFLRIGPKGGLNTGGGGQFCVLAWSHHGNNVYSFASAKQPNWHVGIMPNGNPKPANMTGTGVHGQFLLINKGGMQMQPQPIQQPIQQPMMVPMMGRGRGRGMRGRMRGMRRGRGRGMGRGMMGRVVVSQPIQPVLVEGRMIHLQSLSSKKNIRTNMLGMVSGVGGLDPVSTWKVRVTPNGRVRFQNRKFQGKYLRIGPLGGLNTGPGGGHCIFIPIRHGDGSFSFASAKHKGWHIGIKENGNGKNGKKTGTGMHGRFRIVHSL